MQPRPRHLGFALLIATATAAFGIPSPGHGQSQYDPWQTVEGEASAMSGDTVIVEGSTIRLYGIDAPELGQTCHSRSGQPYDCGAMARNFLEQALAGRTINCTIFSQAVDGIQVGRCAAGSTDIGLYMVGHGWAFAARGLSNRYGGTEARAQARGAGVWSGRSVQPWVWRQQQEAPADP